MTRPQTHRLQDVRSVREAIQKGSRQSLGADLTSGAEQQGRQMSTRFRHICHSAR